MVKIKLERILEKGYNKRVKEIQMKNFFISIALLFLFLPTGNMVQAADDNSLSIIPKPDGEGSVGEAIKNGNLELRHLPEILIHWIDYVAAIAGSIAVIMIVVGGIQYAIGSVSDEKERGKKTLMYALVGVFVVFVSWLGISLYLSWLTS